MRLTPEEVAGIVQALTLSLSGHSAELRLFGSRTDDTLRGGDIDLLLLVGDKEFRSQLVMNKHYMLADIKSKIGEQKIDLKIASKADLETDPFLKVVYLKSVLIKIFNAVNS